MKKIFVFVALSFVSIVQPVLAAHKGSDRGLVDRVLKCESDKQLIEQNKNLEIQNLRQQIYECQTQRAANKVWSCQAGCRGLGNVGFGTGRSEAEARKNALQDLGFTCTEHTFDCHQE